MNFIIQKLKNIIFFETTLLVWFFVVFFSYVYFHNYHFALLLTTIASFVVFGCWKYLFKKQIKSELLINTNKSLWQYCLSIVFIILIITFVLRFFGNLSNNNLNLFSFLYSELDVFYQITLKIGFIIGLILLTSALGSKIFNFCKLTFDTKLEEFIFSIGIGFLTLVNLTFFLTTLGWLFFWPSWFLIFLLTIFSWKEILDWIKFFLTIQLNLKITTNLNNQQTQTNLIWILVIIFFIGSFFITFRSTPTEIDDLDTYFNVPQLYSYYHHIIPFYNSPSAPSGGIVMSFYALINTTLAPHFVFHLSWLFLVLLVSSLYLFTSKFFSQQIAITTLLLATFTPWHIFFVATQKIDFLFTFISILAIYSLFNWLKDNKTKWLYLTAILTGFSLSIKINGVFLIISIGFLLLILRFKKIITLWRIIGCGIIIFLFSSPMLAFNLYYYQNPIPSLMGFSLKPKTEKIFSDDKKVMLNDIYNQTDFAKKRNRELTAMGRQNNPTDSKIINFFWLLWNLTINQKGINMLYIEIGPYLLIFLPFFIYSFFKKKYYQDKNLLYLSIVSTIFMILWFWRGAERPWYGMAIFYLLFIFTAIILNDIKSKKYNYIFYGFIILFASQIIISLLTVAATRLPNTIFLSKTDLQRFSKDDSQTKMYNFINQEIISKNNQAFLLFYLKSDIAHIHKNDQLVIPDRRSIYWGKIVNESESLEKIKETLLNQKITHILYSTELKKGLQYMDQVSGGQANDYEILKEIIKFEEFRDKFLTPLYCADKDLCIYTINN